MQVLFSIFLMNFSKIYEIRNYLLKISNISHLYLVCLNILEIIPIITEIKMSVKRILFLICDYLKNQLKDNNKIGT